MVGIIVVFYSLCVEQEGRNLPQTLLEEVEASTCFKGILAASCWKGISDCEFQFEVGMKFCSVGKCLSSRRSMVLSPQIFSVCFRIIWKLPHFWCCCNALAVVFVLGFHLFCINRYEFV